MAPIIFYSQKWKSVCSLAFLEMSDIYVLENPERVAFPNRILRNHGTKLLETHEIGTVPGKSVQIGSLPTLVFGVLLRYQAVCFLVCSFFLISCFIILLFFTCINSDTLFSAITLFDISSVECVIPGAK